MAWKQLQGRTSTAPMSGFGPRGRCRMSSLGMLPGSAASTAGEFSEGVPKVSTSFLRTSSMVELPSANWWVVGFHVGATTASRLAGKTRVLDDRLRVVGTPGPLPEQHEQRVGQDRDPQGGKIEIKEGQQKLFPIRLVDFEVIRDWECFDADSGKDLGVEIREYFIPDFTNWMDHDAFEKAFDRLLDDLKPEEMNPPEKTHEQ